MNTIPAIYTNTGVTCSECCNNRIVVLSAAQTTIKQINGRKVKVTDQYEQAVCLKCDSVGKEILSTQDFSTRKNSTLVKSSEQFISSAENIVCSHCGSTDVDEQHSVVVNANTKRILADDMIDHYCEDCGDYCKVIWN